MRFPNPNASRVTGLRVERAPEPAAERLNGRTAFDAFIEYETDGGQMGFIGIETKLLRDEATCSAFDPATVVAARKSSAEEGLSRFEQRY